MLIENPATLLAACTVLGGVINLSMMKISPAIKARARHMISGIGPTAATLGVLIGTNDSVVASGTDLLVLGGSAVLGIAAAIGSTKFVTPQSMLPES